MIKEAAIQRKSDGKIWTGRRHSDIIGKIIYEGETANVLGEEFEQGFVDDEGIFYNRRFAYKIAKQHGQISGFSNRGYLDSYDLY